MTRAYQAIVVAEREGGITVTLSNPARKNAIGPRMVNELLYALDDAASEDRVRAVVITGAGDAFCAGGDFAQMTSGPDATELAHRGDYADLLLAITRSPKPIIARVNGVAMGGGLGLVAASHFAIAAETADLGTPEIKVGLFPMMIMAVLARIVPQRKLLEMMLLGEKMSAGDAARFGLVNAAVPLAELDAKVDELVAKVASKSPSTTRLGLEAFAHQADLALDEALPYLRDRLGAVLGTDDAREGLTAFLEKRKPVWKGK